VVLLCSGVPAIAVWLAYVFPAVVRVGGVDVRGVRRQRLRVGCAGAACRAGAVVLQPSNRTQASSRIAERGVS